MVHFVPLPQPDSRFQAPPPNDATILIVGSGPAGLLSSLLLAKNNIKSVIIERHSVRTGQPKAHAINARSLEILRQAGLDTTRLREQGTSSNDSGVVKFVTVTTKTEIGSLPYERQDEAVKELTPEPLFNLPQPVLEIFLQEAALDTGLVTIHRRWSWQDVQSEPTGRLISTVVNRDSNEEIKIASDCLIGADGAESSVRKKMVNVSFDGIPGHSDVRRHYVSIHVRASLRETMHKLGDRYAMLYFCMHPEHRGAILMYDLDSNFVLARTIDPVKEPPESFTLERSREMVEGCLGTKIDCEIVSANMWYTDPRIATHFADESFRIFLAGDSAHTFPPTGGLGINTGIADVHNLCWKLSAVLQGQAAHPEQLLSTYTSERRPVAIANALQSFVNQSRQREDLEPTLWRILDGVPLDDYDAIDAKFKKPDIAEELKKVIARNTPHFDSLGLQLGYIYGEADHFIPDECSIYTPSSRPGARLPHCWLPDGRSVLDTTDFHNFTLYYRGAGFRKETYVLQEREYRLSKVDVDALGATKGWLGLMGIGNGEGVLVRPDQHIVGKLKKEEDIERLIGGYL